MAVDAIGPKDESTEFDGPISTYEVLAPKPLTSDARFVAADLYAEETGVQATPQTHPQQSVAVKIPARKPHTPPAVKAKAKSAGEKRDTASVKMVVALGIGLGFLGALAIVAFVLLPGKPADNGYDMGTVTSTSSGLKGHLITNWGNRLNYKLTIEPSDVSQIDAFATTVNNPRLPIALNVQLKDVSGTVLCGTPVLLKYDPLKNLPNAAAGNPMPEGAKKNTKFEEESARNQAEVERSLNNARLVSRELQREHGKDIFQTVNGEDGQVASLAAQGTLPCSKRQYQSAVSWAFTTDFPSVLQPAGSQDLNASNDLAFGGEPGATARSGLLANRRARRRVSLPASHFSLEQDDTLVGYQAATGMIETRGGKAFLMERRDLVASSLKGIDLPIPIHYRCDQMGACALAGLNAGIQRAWLER